MKCEAAYIALSAFANLENSSIHDVTQAIPGAASILQSFGIDPYENRHALLHDCMAVDGKGTTVLTHLKSLVRIIERAMTEPDILISYLLTHFHDTHREGISDLVCMANKIEARHASHPCSPCGLALQLDRLDELAATHIRNEEQLLFAVMSRRVYSPIAPNITGLSFEHEEQDEILRNIERLTGMFHAPDGAPESWRLLYTRLRQLHVAFKDHNRLEEEVLFPCFMASEDKAYGDKEAP